MMLQIGRASRLLKNKGFTLLLRAGAGFTFIELVLVTIIILVLIGLSTPLFRSSFTNIQQRNTIHNLVQLIRYVQAKAIAERKICRINFDFEKGTFWPTVQDDELPDKFIRIKGKWGLTFKAAEGISIEGKESFITFYPDGSSAKAEIKVSDRKGRISIITTQKNIGYIKIEE